MNYFNPNLSKEELLGIKSYIEKWIDDYPEESTFRQKLEEDLWD